MDECARVGVALGIATTTSRSNVDALLPALFGRDWQERYAAIVCAEDAPHKKPDPMAYAVALRRMGRSAASAMAIEDSPAGLQAAAALGICTLITRSQYFAADTFSGAAAVCDDLESPVALAAGTTRACVDLHAFEALHEMHLVRAPARPAMAGGVAFR
jgi:beta-phosphoglucomutase-like phosphatase (HAD superfamily)